MKNILMISLMIFLACESKPDRKSAGSLDAQNEAILGEWENLSMTITIKDPDSVAVVPEGKWEEILKIKPIRTIFKADSTYVSQYSTLEDSVFMTSSGTWYVDGDSLFMEMGGDFIAYHFNFDNDKGTFSGYLDWDEDGDEDDHYFGIQKKIIEKR